MASSLNGFFSTKIDPTLYGDDDASTSGSETESMLEEDNFDSDEYPAFAKKRRTDGGVTPPPPMGTKVQRNPTRRPNPKISNRNALLARENRRRKKEHVENLEKELDELKEHNGRILKALKSKTKLVKQLTKERNYLKSVIANRTGIMAVLKSVQQTGLPMTSSELRYVTEPVNSRSTTGSSCDEGFSSSPQSSSMEDKKFDLHGLAAEEVLYEDEFSRLPDMDELLSAMGASTASTEKVITTEHNYFEHSNHTSSESGPAGGGVCVHIVPGGRVSVEFCASCALSSQRAWLEDAQER